MKVSRAAEILFGELTDDIRRASKIPAGRELAPEETMRVCQVGFRQIFGKGG
jgi:hypothetical protein